MAPFKMPEINHVTITGNLTRDPSFRHTANRTPVVNFCIATNRRYRDHAGQWREDVCYVGVVAWHKLAESCGKNLTKGSAVLVEGELQSRLWKTEDGDGRTVVEIKAHRVQFLDRHVREEAFAEQDTASEEVGLDDQQLTAPPEGPSV